MHDERTEVKNLEDAKKQMLLSLEQMSKNGVEVFVDGQAVLPIEAVSKAVREDSPYMEDYVFGATGDVEQVRFDKVTRL